MLSDEEKEAIEWLKRLVKLNKRDNLDDTFAEILLNLIEKQSKEIEELKTQIDEHVYYDLGGRSCGKTELLRHYKKGYDMNNKFWEDKIKAIIEELENYYREIFKQDNSPNEFLIEQDCLSKLSILQEVKQSLLDKE